MSPMGAAPSTPSTTGVLQVHSEGSWEAKTSWTDDEAMWSLRALSKVRATWERGPRCTGTGLECRLYPHVLVGHRPRCCMVLQELDPAGAPADAREAELQQDLQLSALVKDGEIQVPGTSLPPSTFFEFF